jgi:hypothetical protein
LLLGRFLHFVELSSGDKAGTPTPAVGGVKEVQTV